MARYNKIFAGPVQENMPQVQEAPCDGAILPGTFSTITAGVMVNATAGGAGKIYIVQENYLTMKGVDAPYLAGETTIGMEMLDEMFYNVRVPTGVNVLRGSPITVGASGKAALAVAGNVVVAYAEEAYNNTSGADQLVRVRPAKGRTIPAA